MWKKNNVKKIELGVTLFELFWPLASHFLLRLLSWLTGYPLPSSIPLASPTPSKRFYLFLIFVTCSGSTIARLTVYVSPLNLMLSHSLTNQIKKISLKHAVWSNKFPNCLWEDDLISWSNSKLSSCKSKVIDSSSCMFYYCQIFFMSCKSKFNWTKTVTNIGAIFLI